LLLDKTMTYKEKTNFRVRNVGQGKCLG
jgi:hypothetical protein